ncbi:MAG: hypothetical protein M1833_004330 [Piccolia ochrophora]|nr:MAG: hypothetical protein M1833_004330 [Piccolia ochrophora]
MLRRSWENPRESYRSARLSLGDLLEEQKRFADSANIYGEAFEVTRSYNGLEIYFALKVGKQSASVLFRSGRLEEAEALSRQLLECCKKTSNGDEEEALIAYLRTTLATCLESEVNHPDEAGKHFLSALDCISGICASEHEEVVAARQALALCLLETEQYKEAKAQFVAVLDAWQKRPEEHEEDILDYKSAMGFCMAHQGRDKDAETFGKAVVEGYERLLGNDDEITQEAKERLAMFKRLAEASEAGPS